VSVKKSDQKRVFVTRPIAETALRRLAQAARVDMWDDELPPPHDHLVAQLKHCDGVLSMVSDRLDASTIAASPRLAAISNLAVGVDNVDLASATQAGIPVGHTPGILTETTADFAFALLMAVARRVAEGDRYVRAKRWRAWTPRLMLGHDVWGATLGIIGWGAIGQAVARRGAGFGMRLLYLGRDRSSARDQAPSRQDANASTSAPPAAERTDLETLLRESDFVSLHVPLKAETRHLIGAHELAAMKPGAILINTARGPIVDQAALVVALSSGRLGGAGLDVTEVEPIATDDPILKLSNVVITPHIGSASHATRLRMAELAVDNLLDVFAGRLPRFCANPQVKLRDTDASTESA
jgi:glyoxylate reductase